MWWLVPHPSKTGYALACSCVFSCVFVRFCLLSFFLSFWPSKEHTDIGLRTGMTRWILENLDECCMKERMAEWWRTSELGLVTRCGSGDDDLVFAVYLLHFSHPVDWHVGGEICSCIESKLHGFFTIFKTEKKILKIGI
jgi:hypothetical protein